MIYRDGFVLNAIAFIIRRLNAGWMFRGGIPLSMEIEHGNTHLTSINIGMGIAKLYLMALFGWTIHVKIKV
ncbi:MAG: hypothetical protein CR997_12305 [Acidobacteria bacterium]|nr:MAG: hypothetical protein CR997_12305 [Acidobacteriota bacterium]